MTDQREIVDIEEAAAEAGMDDLTEEQKEQLAAAVKKGLADLGEMELEEVTEVTGLVPATEAAMDLVQCEIHDFLFLRTAKEKTKIKGAHQGEPKNGFHRSDTFYCRHCLRYTMMDRSENGDSPPLWFKDDR